MRCRRRPTRTCTRRRASASWSSSTLGDIRDLEPLAAYVAAVEPEIVFHMAAQSVVLQSYADPVETYSSNVLGTVHTLEAIRRARRACVVVNVTSDKCYENKGWVWGYRETDALGGHDPYSNSKACAELVGQCYRDSYFPPSRWEEHRVAIANARAGNVVGGGDWTLWQLIPEAIAAFSRSQAVMLRNPRAVRPWQHVLDCLGGYIALAEALASNARTYCGDWNYGPADNDSRQVAYVVDALAAHWGIAPPWVQDPSIDGVPTDVLDAASKLAFTTALLINLGIDRADWSESAITYFNDEDIAFSRINLPHMFSPNNAPPGCGTIQAEVYFSDKYQPMPTRLEHIVERSIEDLHRCGFIRETELHPAERYGDLPLCQCDIRFRSSIGA